MFFSPLPPQQQDVRSLAAFRILAGTYILYDIITRLQHGRLSLLYYTSTPADASFFHPNDTPHKSPIHQIWFYRGSEMFQILLFTLTFLLALSFSLGYKCNVTTKTCLWLNIVAMQCRCMAVHDGSDSYFRHLLLWSIFLPLERVWSVDAWMMRNRRGKYETRGEGNGTKEEARGGEEEEVINNVTSCYILEKELTIEALAIRLQIVLMYLGTVMNRTVDPYGYNPIRMFQQCKWLPPQLTAVHYALSGSLATRDIWLGNMVRTNPSISKIMTLAAMMIEGLAPILCLFVKENHVYIPQFALFQLHLGLFVLMNLPNWQMVGMIATTIFTPCWVWDKVQLKLALLYPNTFRQPGPVSLKKKDLAMGEESKSIKSTKKKRLLKPITYFLFGYMLYDFAGNRNWIRKIDSGDIGEGIRFSQFWVMYEGPPTTTSQVMLTGSLPNIEGDGVEEVNIWHWMKHNGDIQRINMTYFKTNDEIWTNFTHVYPDARIERAMNGWRMDIYRTKHFLRGMCQVTPFTEISFTMQHLRILPPGSAQRYTRTASDVETRVTC